MAEQKEPGYAEAIAEIEKILTRFDKEEFDIDSLACEVKRATELIKVCRDKLRRAEQDVARVLNEEEDR